MLQQKAGRIGFDRQVKSLQFKIQQEIVLLDDEIERLSGRLSMRKSEIIQEQQILDSINREIESEKRISEGKKKRIRISKSLEKAQIVSSHQQVIQNIKKDQTIEIEELQNRFEKELEFISQNSNSKTKEKLRNISKEIDTLRDTTMTNSIALSKFHKKKDPIGVETTSYCLGINNGLIMHLRSMVEQLNDDRVDGLKKSYEQIEECVNYLEELDKEHNQLVKEKNVLIKNIDNKYENDVKRLTQHHDHSIRMLRGHLLEAEKRSQTLKKAAQKLEESNEKQLRETIKEIDMMKYTGIFGNVNNDKGDDRINLKTLQEQLNKSIKELEMRDFGLSKLREENNLLKKRIMQIKHEIRFNK